MNLRQIFERTGAILIFILAIVIGMQTGNRAQGQTPSQSIPSLPPAGTGAPSAPTDNQQINPALNAQPAQQVQQPQAPPPPAPSEAAQAPAPQASPAPSQAPQAGASPAPSPVFIPSEVETYTAIPDNVVDPRLVLKTSMGEIVIRLFPALAPRNVRSVIELAHGDREFVDVKTSKRIKKPFYNGLTFHRVVPDFLIQTGCPFGNGRGGPGFTTPDEFSTAIRFSKPGIVAMAPLRVGTDYKPDSNGSQFFITLAPMPQFNDKLTIIGEVEKGLNVVKKISQARTGPTDRPIQRIFLQSVQLIDKTGTYSTPRKGDVSN